MTRHRLPETRDGINVHLVLQYASADQPSPRELDLYITANLYPNGLVGEVFCSAGSVGSRTSGWLDLCCVMLSVALQCGADFEALVSKWRGQRFDPQGLVLNAPACMLNSDSPHVHVSSPADAVGRWLLGRFPGGRDATK